MEKKNNSKFTLHLNLPKQLYEWLKKESDNTGITMTNLVRSMIANEIKKTES